jgi:hypothetical protein
MDNKQRHGCVTTWLILIIILNSFIALTYILFRDTLAQRIYGDISTFTIMILGLLSICNVYFALLLLKWKKVGFYGFVCTSLIVYTINLSIGEGIGQSLQSLIGVAVLYGVLQIKGGDRATWNDLE